MGILLVAKLKLERIPLAAKYPENLQNYAQDPKRLCERGEVLSKLSPYKCQLSDADIVVDLILMLFFGIE